MIFLKRFIQLFKKVDGLKVLKQYAKSHVLIYALSQTLLNGFSKKSLEIVRLSVNNKIFKRLRKKYIPFIHTYVQENEHHSLEHQKSNYMWFCWLQGIDQAPNLVKKCYQSLLTHFTGKEIVLLTEENYRQYVTFPKHIQEKIDSGIITKTHFSDLLRLELLINHGGTWIDATVYCSGNNYPAYMFDSDLFMFQNLKPGLDGHSTRISSWFMTATTNHPILLLTRALLYHYWEKNNDLVDYFLLHDFLELAIETYPKEWNKVVPFSNSTPHILLLRLFEDYDENIWNALKDTCSIHKLTYKFDKEKELLKGSYYEKIFK